MDLVFVGTKGKIEASSKRHHMHTSLLVKHGKSRILIDCGETWLKKFRSFRPSHIVLTHAHPDHAWGLQEGAPCPVWATKETWSLIQDYPIENKKLVEKKKKIKIGAFTFTAFPLIHSLKAPAVGYRVQIGKKAFFYAPDVAWIEDRKNAWKNISFYIGDGATFSRDMIRKDRVSGQIFGHVNIQRQIGWCAKENVAKMIVTHCGTEIVTKEKQVRTKIQQVAQEKNVQVEIAYDGKKISL